MKCSFAVGIGVGRPGSALAAVGISSDFLNPNIGAISLHDAEYIALIGGLRTRPSITSASVGGDKTITGTRFGPLDPISRHPSASYASFSTWVRPALS